jgi:hypothetical protein
MIENTSQNFKELWLEVYNSIVRLKFYMYLESCKKDRIVQLDREFTLFAQTHINPKEKELRFFGGNTLMAFSYLVLVRMFEALKEEFGQNEMEQILNNASWNYIGGDEFSVLKDKYNIEVRVLVDRNAKGKMYYTNEKEELIFFLRKLRNSVKGNGDGPRNIGR